MFLSSIGETITGSGVDDKFRIEDDSWSVSHSKLKSRIQKSKFISPV